MKTFAEFSQNARSKDFLVAWTGGIAGILEQLTSNSHQSDTVDPDSLDAAARSAVEQGVRVNFRAGGVLRGELSFLVSHDDALPLAQFLMGEPIDAAATVSDAHRDAVPELLRQVAGMAASDLKTKWNAEVSFAFAGIDAPTWASAAVAAIRVTVSENASIHIVLNVQDQLLWALESAETTPDATPDSAGRQNPPFTADDDAAGSNLSLLLDVELDATIRFGQREMLLRDVLDLRSGAVIELERHVEEPAELLVAGRLVARGEVVVVEGNYALRITEIVGQRQRYEAIGK